MTASRTGQASVEQVKSVSYVRVLRWVKNKCLSPGAENAFYILHVSNKILVLEWWSPTLWSVLTSEEGFRVPYSLKSHPVSSELN
jgi:hypothetical protein